MTLFGLRFGGLIPPLCTLFVFALMLDFLWSVVRYFCLGANYLSSSYSRSWRYFSIVLLISSNSNSIASILFSIYSAPSIAWCSTEAGGDFDLASGFPADDLFYNTWIKS